MRIIVLLLFALIVPFFAATLVLVPIHIGLTAACYLVYMQADQQGPILAHALDPFFILKTYQRLIEYWLAHQDTVPFLTHTAPLIVLPAVVILGSLYFGYRFVLRVKEQFDR